MLYEIINEMTITNGASLRSFLWDAEMNLVLKRNGELWSEGRLIGKYKHSKTTV